MTNVYVGIMSLAQRKLNFATKKKKKTRKKILKTLTYKYWNFENEECFSVSDIQTTPKKDKLYGSCAYATDKRN